jgi:hypothetical protein
MSAISPIVAPGEEPHDGAVISHAGVLVADGGGEELQKAARGLGDHARHQHAGAASDAFQRPGFGWHKGLWFAIRFHGVLH